MSGRLLRTIRLDPSDAFAFARAAEPGEWAVPGSFLYLGVAEDDVAAMPGKARVAFRSGFLGLTSFGFSTICIATTVTPAERDAAVEALAAHLVAEHGAPDMAAARAAAAEEVAFSASLAEHPEGTLIVIHRTLEEGDVRERFRTVKPGLRFEATAPFSPFVAVEDGPEEVEEHVDLLALARPSEGAR